MKNKKIQAYFFSMIPWENKLLHRAHMLAKYFDKLDIETYYVQRKPTFNILNLFKKPVIYKDHNITIVTIYALPYVRGKSKLVFKLNDMILKNAYKKFLNPEGKMIIQTPHWGKSLIKSGINPEHLFYDISDDYLDFTDSEKWRRLLKDYEDDLCEEAHKVFISSINLAVKSTQNKTVLIQNGVDIDSFSSAEKALTSKKQIIGFIGGLFEWIDFDLIDMVCSIFTEEDIALIGPSNQLDKIKKLQQHKNFTYYGEIDKGHIANYFASLNIGLIPFVTTDLYPRLKTVNSNKVYQYLYFGYPVVSTTFPQVKKLSDAIFVSKSKEQFITNIERALQETDPHRNTSLDGPAITQRQNGRVAIAKNNSWETMAAKMISELH